MTDEEICERAAECTSRHPRNFRVLYGDGKRALVRHPGQSETDGVSSACVLLFDLGRPNVPTNGQWVGTPVWDSDPRRNGRLTAPKLRDLVEKLGLDPAHLRVGRPPAPAPASGPDPAPHLAPPAAPLDDPSYYLAVSQFARLELVESLLRPMALVGVTGSSRVAAILDAVREIHQGLEAAIQATEKAARPGVRDV